MTSGININRVCRVVETPHEVKPGELELKTAESSKKVSEIFSTNVWKNVTEEASKSFFPDMNQSSMSCILEAVKEFPEEERMCVMQLAANAWKANDGKVEDEFCVIANLAACMGGLKYSVDVKSMNIRYDIRELFIRMQTIDQNERSMALKYIHQILQDAPMMNGIRFTFEIVKAMIKDGRNDIEDIISKASRLFTVDMAGCARRSIVKIIKEVPAEERTDVVEKVFTLITVGMAEQFRPYILLAVKEIPREERTDVVEKTLQLISLETCIWDRLHILRAVQKMPK